MSENQLSVFKKLKNMIVPKPTYDWSEYDKGTITKIHNALVKGGGVDLTGCIWININDLPTLWRTTSKRTEVILEQVDRSEIQEINNESYLYGPEAVKRLYLEKNLPGASISRRKYLAIALDMYRQLDESDAVENRRNEFQNALVEAKASLKGERQKLVHTDVDELTGAPLKVDAQFSHIRAFHVYPGLGLKRHNGLIVNPETHKVITKENVVNEKELLKLCIRKGWNTDWYDDYMEWLRSEDP